MNEKLKAYFEKMEEDKKQRAQYEKDELLISQGLYETVYSDTPQSGYTYDKKAKKYYKLIPIEVSDDEYQRILDYVPDTIDPPKPSIWNTVMRIFAWSILVVVLIYGLVLCVQYILAGDLYYGLLIAVGAIVVAFLSASGVMIFIDMAQNVADIEQLLIFHIFRRK